LPSLTSFFQPRVEDFIRPWPEPMRGDLRRRLGITGRRPDGAPRLDGLRVDQPYWILLPFWIAGKYRGRHRQRAAEKKFLDDILWGQYCLFVFIRLQDDLFDRHTDRVSYLYASDMFLLESERTFSRYFPKSSPFWKIFRECIEETIFAIITADEMERRPVKKRERLLDALGATSTICNVAPAALCIRAGRMRDFRRVAAFSTAMMKAGAIVDDIEDMEQDHERGRFNYAASFFLRGFRMEGPWEKRAIRSLKREVLTGGKLSALFREIHHHLDAAEVAVRPFTVPAALEYLRSFRRSVVAMELSFHRDRMMTFLGKN
jgi:hypothetical protein